MYSKDNDLIAKIRLQPDDAIRVIEVLNKDSDALCGMGIMDYSLLIGIKNIEYDVERMTRTGLQSGRRPSLTKSTSTTLTPVGANGGLGRDGAEGGLRENSTHPPGEAVSMPPGLNNTAGALGTGLPARAVVAPSIYYLGVVDILQTWSMGKRLERFVKVNFKRQRADGISCIAPETYKIRFQKKV